MLSPYVSDSAAAMVPIERTKPFMSCSFRMISPSRCDGCCRSGRTPARRAYSRRRCCADLSGHDEPMSVVEVDRATGALVVGGRKLFPIVLSNGPPLGAKAPNGKDALAELSAGGANFLRVGRPVWSLESIDEQIAAARDVLDAAA